MAVVTSVPHLALLGALPEAWIEEYITLENHVLTQLQDQYYYGDQSVASDADYDRMFRELKSLVEEFPEYKSLAPALDKVG